MRVETTLVDFVQGDEVYRLCRGMEVVHPTRVCGLEYAIVEGNSGPVFFRSKAGCHDNNAHEHRGGWCATLKKNRKNRWSAY